MLYLSYFRSYLPVLVGLLFTVSCSRESNKESFTQPADFEPSASTCFIWTTDFYEIIPELASLISQKDKVTLYAGEQEDVSAIEQVLQQHNGNLSNIRIVQLKDNPNNAWIRDFGPVYLVNGNGERKILSFNYFGKKLSFNDQIAGKMDIPIVYSILNSTGGGREVNGKGTMILCETHERDVNKNLPLEEIERGYKEAMGVSKVIWLKHGIPQDDSELNGPLYDQIYPNGVNGHVDEFCRFADENTLLISSVEEAEAKKHPILAEAKKRLDESYQILLNSTDQDGKALNVVQVPFAPLLVFDRQDNGGSRYMTLVTSYMNFIVTNSYVILPSYVSSAKDYNRNEVADREKRVEEIFNQAFPLKEIIKVPAEDLNRYSGGFHCISINEPLVK